MECAATSSLQHHLFTRPYGIRDLLELAEWRRILFAVASPDDCVVPADVDNGVRAVFDRRVNRLADQSPDVGMHVRRGHPAHACRPFCQGASATPRGPSGRT